MGGGFTDKETVKKIVIKEKKQSIKLSVKHMFFIPKTWEFYFKFL